MSDTKDQILVGKKDILGALDGQGVDRKQALSDATKEARVRIGTLLKTDSVSFLLGAGCSPGGPRLGVVPMEIEKQLLNEGVRGGRRRRWLQLFYRLVAVCAQLEQSQSDTDSLQWVADGVDILKRHSELVTESYPKTNETDQTSEKRAIPINFERLLTRLFSWYTAGVEDHIALRLDSKPRFDIHVDALKTLLDKLTVELAKRCGDLRLSGDAHHGRFLRKLLTRPVNLQRVKLFTLNYDTLLEQAADAEGVVLVDGFVGTLKRIFRPESFDQDVYFPAHSAEGGAHRSERVAHLYKLHGSVTWRAESPSWNNPYGVYTSGDTSPDKNVLVYPTPLKYSKTLGLPYSELFRRFGMAVCRPQAVLFVIGYGFGDEHVNAIIRQALAVPTFALVIVDPEPKSGFVKQLKDQSDQRVMVVEGWNVGTFESFVENLLPDLREEEVDKKVTETYNALHRFDKGSDDDAG